MNGQTEERLSGTPFVAQEAYSEGRDIYILDPDPAVQSALARLFREENYRVQAFGSAAALLASIDDTAVGVLVLDLHAGDMSGFDVQARLRKCNADLQIIFHSANGDVRKSVQAIKGGAVDFIEKPCSEQRLLHSVAVAFKSATAAHEDRLHRKAVEKRCERLTQREREVMAHIVSGVSNKDLAERLGLSKRTVEIHRARIMTKMEATSFAELVRMVYLCSDARPEEILANGIAPPTC